MKVSVFKTIRQTQNPTQREVSDVLKAIKNGVVDDLVNSIRNEGDKKTRQQLKKKLPCILFSGTFSERADDAIIEHSGIICLDFDEFKTTEELEEYKFKLREDKYSYCVFISPSGVGLKVLVKIPADIDNHRQYFKGLESYYQSEHFDSSCVNESRVCYMSSDDDIFINENSKTFTAKAKKEVKEHKNLDVVIDDKDKIIDGLYKWWEKKYGIIEGERNRNTYILAMAFNEFGITEFDARNFLSQFEHNGFDINEINSCISSAYSKSHLFGTKKFSGIETYYEEVDKSSEDKTNVNFHNIYSSAFVDVTAKIEHPPTAISIGTHKISGVTYPTDFATYGNFSCITGASKSRKTFFKSLITARYRGDASKRFGSLIKGHESKELYVLDIDTEQSKFHAQKVFKRIPKMLNVKNHELYKPFALRPYTPKERVEFIEWLIYESEFKNNTGLVLIDGLADLVDDFNDLKESQKIIQKIMKWTDDKQFHLNTILHSNFGSSKAVGHIGSSALKKAETICRASTENNITNVTFSHTRGFPIEDINFMIDDDGLPYLLDDVKDIEEEPEKKEEKIDLTKYQPKKNSDIIF